MSFTGFKIQSHAGSMLGQSVNYKLVRHTLSIGLLLSSLLGGNLASAQITANSLAELRAYGLSVNNMTVTLSTTGGDPHPVTGIVTPGEYWINGDHIADPTGTEPIFMDLSGNGNTYNLSGTVINADTRDFAGYGRALGHGSGVHLVQVSGTNNLLTGLTLIGQDIALDTDPNAQRYADWGTQYGKVTGDNNTIHGATIVVRGSRTDTYGLSDAFGKGSSQGMAPYIGHRKAAGMVVDEATNALVNNLDLTMKTFGHGFFTGSSVSDTTLTNSTITGELFPSQLVIDRPEYQQYGHTWWGYPIQDDIQLSGSEGGVRTYGGTNFTVDNVVVDGMRTGFATVATGGDVNITNSFAYNTTSGFDVGDNTTIAESGGNIVNGPLLVFYGSGSNTSIDLELTAGTPVGVNWSAAYFNGEADISISSDLAAGDLPEESYVRLGQRYFENWRDSDFNTATPDSNDPRDYTNATFSNNTNQILVIGENAEGNVGSSQAPVISNGKENYYDGVTLVPAGITTNVRHNKGLGNSGIETGAEFDGNDNVIYTGTATAQTVDDNSTVVESGGTLSLMPGINITNEKLTISGNGVGGVGALYSDGSVGSTIPSFGSLSRGGDGTIFLDGSASIGVGLADNQLSVLSIQGTGNLTKRGLGILSIEYASSYDGSLTVAEGEVIGGTDTVRQSLTVNPGATIRGVSDDTFNSSEVMFINGTMDMNALTDDSSLSGKIGTLFGSGNIGASNLANTTENQLTIDVPSNLGFFTGTIDDNIELIKTGAGEQVLFGDSTYTGRTTINEGILRVDGNHTGGDFYYVSDGGILAGSGGIDSNVYVVSGGTVSPGASAGILTVDSAEFYTGSSFEVELGGTSVGTEYDQLSAADLALGGTLVISFLNNFTPDSFDVFTIVMSSNLSGSFENVADGERVDTADGEGSFLVSYNSSSNLVELSSFLVSSGLLEGDFNLDGIVDAADYTMWRDTLGQTGLTPFDGADADGDGQITQADYMLWLANYGVTSITSSSTAVPEPSGLIVLLGAVACFAGRSPYRIHSE